jgi:hypothetical protein
MFRSFLDFTILELFAIAYTVGADLRVGPHTQVCPYTDSQTAPGSCATDVVITLTSQSRRASASRSRRQTAPIRRPNVRLTFNVESQNWPGVPTIFGGGFSVPPKRLREFQAARRRPGFAR